MEIKKTKKYGLFKTINSNREINLHHVRELADSIEERNMLHLNPIIVNEKMEVIDGQHRIEAAKLLSCEIFYLQEKGLSDTDIPKINRDQKNWNVMDYITFWALKKKPGYDVLMKYMRKHKLRWTVAMLLLSNDSRNDKRIKEGVCQIDNLEMAEKIIEVCHDLSEFGGFIYSSKFMSALKSLMKSNGYDHQQVLKNIKKNGGIKEQLFVKDYREVLIKLSS